MMSVRSKDPIGLWWEEFVEHMSFSVEWQSERVMVIVTTFTVRE